MQIFLFLKNLKLGKCPHLIFLYIIGYNNISLRPHDTSFTTSIPKSRGCRPTILGLTPMGRRVMQKTNASFRRWKEQSLCQVEEFVQRYHQLKNNLSSCQKM